MIRNWNTSIADRWLGSEAMVTSPKAPPSRQQARQGRSSAASRPPVIRTPIAAANATTQPPWKSATRASPKIFPATSVSRLTGATNSVREKSVLPVLGDRDHARGGGLEQGGGQHSGEREGDRGHAGHLSHRWLQHAAEPCHQQDREGQVHREPGPVPQQLDEVTLGDGQQRPQFARGEAAGAP